MGAVEEISFTDKQKIQFSTTRPALQQSTKTYILQAERTRNEKLQMEKLTVKRHTLKERNYLHTNISKPATVRRGEHKCRTGNAFEIRRPTSLNNLVLYNFLYQNYVVTPLKIYTRYTKTKKESSHNLLKLIIRI